jgi:hypothetical protein
MVEDTLTDSERIAQLLASELTGLAVDPLDAVTVVDADRDVSPSSDGPVAYRIHHREQPVGEVRLYPDAARLRVRIPAETVPVSPLDVDRTESGDAIVASIDSGTAVKAAVDLLRNILDEE